LAALFLMPSPKASSKRWMEDLGSHFPTPEQRLQHRLILLPVTACPMDGSSPWGTDKWVMVGKDAQARLLMPHEAAGEHGDAARQWLQR